MIRAAPGVFFFSLGFRQAAARLIFPLQIHTEFIRVAQLVHVGEQITHSPETVNPKQGGEHDCYLNNLMQQRSFQKSAVFFTEEEPI